MIDTAQDTTGVGERSLNWGACYHEVKNSMCLLCGTDLRYRDSTVNTTETSGLMFVMSQCRKAGVLTMLPM